MAAARMIAVVSTKGKSRRGPLRAPAASARAPVVFEREEQEVLEEDAAVARLVGVGPERAGARLLTQEALALLGREVRVDALEVARQILKRLFEVELHGVDELAVGPLDHHLVAAEVRGREELEALWQPRELQAVVLPHAEDVALGRVVVPGVALALVQTFEDGVGGLCDADEAVLVLEAAPHALLARLLLVERDAAHAEAEPDELVAAADAEDGRRRLHREGGEAAEHRG